jgi:hypothetical protein
MAAIYPQMVSLNPKAASDGKESKPELATVTVPVAPGKKERKPLLSLMVPCSSPLVLSSLLDVQ